MLVCLVNCCHLVDLIDLSSDSHQERNRHRLHSHFFTMIFHINIPIPLETTVLTLYFVPLQMSGIKTYGLEEKDKGFFFIFMQAQLKYRYRNQTCDISSGPIDGQRSCYSVRITSWVII